MLNRINLHDLVHHQRCITNVRDEGQPVQPSAFKMNMRGDTQTKHATVHNGMLGIEQQRDANKGRLTLPGCGTATT